MIGHVCLLVGCLVRSFVKLFVISPKIKVRHRCSASVTNFS